MLCSSIGCAQSNTTEPAQAVVQLDVIIDWRSDEEDPVRGMENPLNNKHVTNSELQHKLAGKYEEMNQAMLQLALENPDLMRALTPR
jgi:hypothetical protein